MIADEIRVMLKAQPFIPFKMYVAESSAHEVPHGDWALINPAGSMMVVMDKDGLFHWISVAHITRIVPMPSAASV